ncbi:MAG: hypothetical protein ACJAUD_001044 [Crocinitomicaceae bacterium]|jgi:hypothetical protein
MIHPSTTLKFISEEKGYGVVATEFIPIGTITWVQDKLDREFTPDNAFRLGTEYASIIETYSFRNQQGNFVLCWDIGRYVNHSFNSNCLTTPYNFEIAIRDIEKGEELTDDYGYLNISEPFLAIDEGSDRKVVYPDDLIRMSPEWDGKLEHSFPFIAEVNQPLYLFLPTDIQQIVNGVLKGERELESVINCYYESKAKH